MFVKTMVDAQPLTLEKRTPCKNRCRNQCCRTADVLTFARRESTTHSRDDDADNNRRACTGDRGYAERTLFHWLIGSIARWIETHCGYSAKSVGYDS